jgi:hypothetical protein
MFPACGRVAKAEMKMATINDGELHLEIPGADEQGLRRGLAAARASLEASGFTLEEVFRGAFEREGADMRDELDDLPQRLLDAANALDDAGFAATKANDPDAKYSNGYLSIQEVWAASERRIDEDGIRDLNPDRGPHYVMERSQSA